MREQVLSYCAELGKDSLLVQGSGGNVSWKDKDVLWIKASGFRLDEALTKKVFVPVDLAALRAELASGNYDASPSVLENNSLRPSIETTLHALIPHKIVVHLHAVEILSRLVRRDIAELLSAAEQAGCVYGVVPYHKPGAPLAEAVARCLAEAPGLSVCFLKNHGVVIGGGDIGEVDDILRRLLSSLPASPLPPETIPAALPPEGCEYTPIDRPKLHTLAREPFFSALKKNWVLYPDHAVFLGAAPIIFESWEEMNKAAKANATLPELIFIKNAGVYALPSFIPAKLEQLECYYEVLTRQKDFSGLNPLPTEQVNELLNWDAEKYRQNLAECP